MKIQNLQRTTGSIKALVLYLSNTKDEKIELNPEDEKNRYYIQLYNKILQSVNISGKSILEVSCGRGGGAFYYMKYKQPEYYLGIDLAKHNVAICKSKNKFKNVEFKIYEGADHGFFSFGKGCEELSDDMLDFFKKY